MKKLGYYREIYGKSRRFTLSLSISFLGGSLFLGSSLFAAPLDNQKISGLRNVAQLAQNAPPPKASKVAKIHKTSARAAQTVEEEISQVEKTTLIESHKITPANLRADDPDFVPHNIQQAMETAYLTNPQLREARAQLRAVDEAMPTAMSGWHPTISAPINLTYYQGSSGYKFSQSGTVDGITGTGTVQTNHNYATPGYNAGVVISEPLFQGGKTVNSIKMAENQIRAERAHLISTEQQVLMQAASAYVAVVSDQQLYNVALTNEKVLREQTKSVYTRFRLGGLSRTDVAQSQGYLATATSARQQAWGNLEAARATYRQVIGISPTFDLEAPQPLVLPVKTRQEAVTLAIKNNPNVIQAQFTEAEQKNNISVQWATILPKVSANVGYSDSVNQGYGGSTSENEYATLGFQFPIYQGGQEYSAVRRAKQVAQGAFHEINVQRRTALQLAASSWDQYQAAQDSISSNRTAVASYVVALAGVERQALLGSASTLSMLQQQQMLFSAQQTLIRSLASAVTNSYAVATAIGRLTAKDLKLAVPLYDETDYYKKVKWLPFGVSDFSKNQPGR
ncbi:secretion protein [Acetobacteraceae bacterium]|nr:secretion protein [Acetobacteraceae bacterium]